MNANHTLSASTTKIGHITGVTVNFTVTFAGENLKVDQNIQVDGITKLDEWLKFKQHYNANHSWDDFEKIVRTFTIIKPLGTFTIRQEAGPDDGWFYNEGRWIGSTRYDLQITNYTYEDGADPGAPGLSDDSFSMTVAPWRTDPSESWYRIETTDVTINAPSVSGIKGSKKVLKEQISHR